MMVSRIGLFGMLIVTLIAGCTEPITHSPATTMQPAGTTMPTATPSLAETSAATETSSPEDTSRPVPPLSWEMLRNASYPNEWPSEGVAQLKDGEYREQYMPDSATEMVINLAPYRLFGDLNGDGVEDAAVILIAAPGGSGTFYYLAAVLNQGGQPEPSESQFLGDRVVLRDLGLADGHIWIELDVAGPDDPMCCPTDRRRKVFAVQSEKLVLVDEEDLPDPDPGEDQRATTTAG